MPEVLVSMRGLYELNGKGRSIHGIAEDLGISRNTVRKYPCLAGAGSALTGSSEGETESKVRV